MRPGAVLIKVDLSGGCLQDSGLSTSAAALTKTSLIIFDHVDDESLPGKIRLGSVSVTLEAVTNAISSKMSKLLPVFGSYGKYAMEKIIEAKNNPMSESGKALRSFLNETALTYQRTPKERNAFQDIERLVQPPAQAAVAVSKKDVDAEKEKSDLAALERQPSEEPMRVPQNSEQFTCGIGDITKYIQENKLGDARKAYTEFSDRYPRDSTYQEVLQTYPANAIIDLIQQKEFQKAVDAFVTFQGVQDTATQAQIKYYLNRAIYDLMLAGRFKEADKLITLFEPLFKITGKGTHPHCWFAAVRTIIEDAKKKHDPQSIERLLHFNHYQKKEKRVHKEALSIEKSIMMIREISYLGNPKELVRDYLRDAKRQLNALIALTSDRPSTGDWARLIVQYRTLKNTMGETVHSSDEEEAYGKPPSGAIATKTSPQFFQPPCQSEVPATHERIVANIEIALANAKRVLKQIQQQEVSVTAAPSSQDLGL